MSENIIKTRIDGLFVIQRPTFDDDRGFFREVFRLSELEEATGIAFVGRQWNHSMSMPRVIRALHAESWNKLVYPVTGNMFAALVDIRPESETFGVVETFTFDSKDRKALFVPIGLGNSICVLGDEPVHYMYLVDAEYTGQDTRAIAWDDPDIAVDWPIKDPIISERDQNNPTLREMFPEKFEGK